MLLDVAGSDSGSASGFIDKHLVIDYKRKQVHGSSYGGCVLHTGSFEKEMAGNPVCGNLDCYLYGRFQHGSGLRRFLPGIQLLRSSSTTPLIIALAAAFAVCIFGGSKQISSITGVLVPVMGIFYIRSSLVIIVTHLNLVTVCRYFYSGI